LTIAAKIPRCLQASAVLIYVCACPGSRFCLFRDNLSRNTRLSQYLIIRQRAEGRRQRAVGSEQKAEGTRHRAEGSRRGASITHPLPQVVLT